MGRVTRQLGQLRPGGTNAASLYSPASGVAVRITAIHVCNTGGNARKFRIFLDHDGAVFDETTAHYWDEALAADKSARFNNLDWFMNDSDGNIGVRSDLASELTFTAYGIELS